MTQGDIDALGGGKTIRDWEARFELAHQKRKDENVTPVWDVCPTTLKFACYLHQTHKVYPKDLWQTQIMTSGSVPGINTHHQSALNALYGRQVVIPEIYGATEGVFDQQRDEERAWVPNYDLFFFEVGTRPSARLRTGSAIKMLHEMQAPRGGAWARLAA